MYFCEICSKDKCRALSKRLKKIRKDENAQWIDFQCPNYSPQTSLKRPIIEHLAVKDPQHTIFLLDAFDINPTEYI